jgi:carbonic anhydrase
VREIVWRIGDPETPREPPPADAATARARVERGNDAFAALFDGEGTTRLVQLAPEELGLSPTGQAPEQRPFAAVLSCADARVPVELLLSQRANDIFVVRVAGGVLSEGALGSLDYATTRLPTVQLALSLGHSGCGAVTAAVDTYLDPPSYFDAGQSRPLLSLVQNLLGAVRMADHALAVVHGPEVTARPGYRAALVDLAVVANAGTSASAIATRIARRPEPFMRGVQTVFGVYDLVSRTIGLPGTAAEWAPGLADVPREARTFARTLEEMAFGPRLTRLLDLGDAG